MRGFFVAAFAIMAGLFLWIAMISDLKLAWIMAAASVIMLVVSVYAYIHDAMRDESDI